MEPSQNPICPVKDCILPVDLVLESSDGKRFGAHTINLQQYSEGFPIGGSVTIETDIPKMPESSQALRLLLRFMHHSRQPYLGNISVKVLSELAEAVEKYVIYSAMELCRLYMKFTVENHPIDVLTYSVKHDYPELANEAARLTLATDATLIVTAATKANLHPSFLSTWFFYREKWANNMRALVNDPPSASSSLHKGGVQECELWDPFKNAVVLDVGVTLQGLLKLEQAIKDNIDEMLDDCTHCSKRAMRWAHHAKTTHAACSLKFE